LQSERLIEARDPLTLDEADRRSVRVIVATGVDPLGPEEMDALPNLGLILTVGAGFDGVDLPAAQARGIRLLTGSGANSEDVADTTIGLFLAATRQIVENDGRVRHGSWRMGDLRPVRSVGAMKVGILGLGAIGRAVGARLVPFRCEIAWTGPNPKPDVSWRYVPDLLDLATESDALLVAAPLNPQTAGIVSAEVIDALGPQGVLVNVGRGGLVDEDALIAALREGRLGAAALDVFRQEPTPSDRWRGVPNLVLSPHTAGVTHQSMQAMFGLAVQRALDFVAESRRAG
jgi:lactate dehydrogenase-like 2-hydroxyacid dehydrogenase